LKNTEGVSLLKDEKIYTLIGVESMIFLDKYGSRLDIRPNLQLVEFKSEEKSTGREKEGDD